MAQKTYVFKEVYSIEIILRNPKKGRTGRTFRLQVESQYSHLGASLQARVLGFSTRNLAHTSEEGLRLRGYRD